MSAFDHWVGEVEQAVELERPGMHRQRTGSGSRFGSLVDNARLDAEPAQPERKHQPGWTGADNQNFAAGHIVLPDDKYSSRKKAIRRCLRQPANSRFWSMPMTLISRPLVCAAAT